MSKDGYQYEFERDVFPAEIEEIRARRQTVGLDDEKLAEKPSAEQGLVGLALSGGGIRSATFSLGVIQALARHGVLKRVDYLSTVSGGGYIGSCMSSLLSEPENTTENDSFPLRSATGEIETPALTHLRNSSNYLSPGGLLDLLRLPNLLLRGILLNLFLVLPYIMFAVFLTEWAYEKGPNWDKLPALVLPLVVLFVIMAIAFPFCIRVLRGVFNWQRRNAYELWLTIPLLLALVVIAAIPLLRLTRLAIEHSWPQVLRWLGNLSSPEIWKVLVLLGLVLTMLALAGKASQNLAKIGGKLALIAIGALGPLIVFAIYLTLCLWQIDSPFLPVESDKVLNEAAACTSESGCLVKAGIADGAREADPTTVREFFRALFSKAEDPTFATLVSEFKGRRTNLSKDARVKCLSETCEFAQGSEPLNWRGDERKWVVNDSGDADFVCPEYESKQELEQRSNPNHRCYYLTRVSERSLRIDGAGLNLFNRSEDFVFFGVFVGLLLFNFFFLDVNITSPHGFYRDRLSKAFLFRRDGDQPFDGVLPNDGLRLSELNQPQTAAPYHLVNVALNLHASKDPNLRGRASDFFLFSKRYVGSDRTAYANTTDMEKYDRHLDLGTAMAISGAAAAPNMGTTKNKSLVFIMTLLNIRLGYWLPNPRKVNQNYWYKNLDLRGAKTRLLWKEAVSHLNTLGSHLNLSDGGHIENLAIYGLLRRRCKFIVAVDGEADPSMTLGGLVTLERFARIDMGVELDIDLSEIRKNEQGLSQKHWTLGKIRYGGGETGYLLYIKLSVSGDESEYIRAYRSENTDYPHESTADQFFSEAQFEAYRALGEHIAEGLLSEDASALGEFARLAKV